MFGFTKKMVGVIITGALFCALELGAKDDGSRDARELLQAAINRARVLADATNAPIYRYDKRTTIQSLNSKGEVTKTKVKLFDVTMTGGIPRERLVGVEGRKLSKRGLAAEEKKSNRWRKGMDRKKKGRSFVPGDLLDKFDFSLVRTESVRGRTTHLISFQPTQPPAAAKNFRDRIIHAMSGRIWIDSSEPEIVSLDVKLGRKVKLWAGLLAVLDQFEIRLDRKRSDLGVWYNDFADIKLNARSFLTRMRLRIREQSSNFGLKEIPAGNSPE